MKINMSRAWRNARKKSEKLGGSSKDYIAAEMKKEWAIAKLLDDDQSNYVTPARVSLRLDDVTRSIVDEMMDDGLSYNGLGDLIRQSILVAYATRDCDYRSEKKEE